MLHQNSQKKINGAPVIASDGTVYSGRTFFNLTKRKYESKNDDVFKSYLINGKRKNKGWLLYQFENGKVQIDKKIGKKLSVTKMLDNIENKKCID